MAVTDPTPNFNWALPDVGGDNNAWGAMIREILGNTVTGLDKVLNDVRKASTIDTGDNDATRAMKEAGGVFTGEIDVFTARYESVDLGATLSGTVTIDLDQGNFFHGTVTGDITLQFSNVPASDVVFFMIELTDSGDNNITWPASVNWPSASEPNPTANGVDLYVAYTRDGGTTVRVSRSMEGSS